MLATSSVDINKIFDAGRKSYNKTTTVLIRVCFERKYFVVRLQTDDIQSMKLH